MPLLDKPRPTIGGIDWVGFARILILQVLALMALTTGIVRYVNWSSEVAWAEFSRATKPAGLDAKAQPRPGTPVQAVKHQVFCARSA